MALVAEPLDVADRGRRPTPSRPSVQVLGPDADDDLAAVVEPAAPAATGDAAARRPATARRRRRDVPATVFIGGCR